MIPNHPDRRNAVDFADGLVDFWLCLDACETVISFREKQVRDVPPEWIQAARGRVYWRSLGRPIPSDSTASRPLLLPAALAERTERESEGV